MIRPMDRQDGGYAKAYHGRASTLALVGAALCAGSNPLFALMSASA